MKFEEIKTLYVQFMKINGRKLNRGSLPLKLRVKVEELLENCLKFYDENMRKVEYISILVELYKSLKRYEKALFYINKILELQPTNRKYINEQYSLLEKKSKSIPIKKERYILLLNFLEGKLLSKKCNRTLDITRAWCKNQIEFAKLEVWLNKNGIYCDCEVMLNFDENM